MTKIEGDVKIPDQGCRRILRRSGFTFLIILGIILQPAVSQGWPQCGFQCSANDVTMTRLWLGDSTGKDLPPCSGGNKQSAYLWISFYNNANKPRYGVILLADVYINGILQQTFYDQGICVLDSIPSKATSSFPIYSFTWDCGQEVKLARTVLSWETSTGTTCSNADRSCSSRSTKCYGGTSTVLLAAIPLSSNFTLNTPVCITNNLNLIDKTAGGNAPYSYNWDFGDKSSSTVQNPTHKYAAVGNYTVTLHVTDQSGKCGHDKQCGPRSAPAARNHNYGHIIKI